VIDPDDHMGRTLQAKSIEGCDPVDPWRRKITRLNQSRISDARVATLGKAALALGIGGVIWFTLQDRTETLEERDQMTPAATVASAEGDDARRLLARDQFADALPLLLPLADKGAVWTQCAAGKILAEGRGGVDIDLVEGSKWLDLCVRDPAMDPEKSDDEAAEMLDRLIKEAGWDIVGEGKYRAFQWQQAFYNTRKGEPGSAAEAVLRDLPNLSAEEAFELGVDLNNGHTLPVDFAKALEAFKHAADGGLKEAMFNVGLSYYVGKGVKPNPAEAKRWLDKAADAGFAKAAMMLGLMAVRGHGMKPSVDAALAYLDRADALGDPQARLLREAVAAGVVPK
jgi:TPR repeat protein